MNEMSSPRSARTAGRKFHRLPTSARAAGQNWVLTRQVPRNGYRHPKRKRHTMKHLPVKKGHLPVMRRATRKRRKSRPGPNQTSRKERSKGQRDDHPPQIPEKIILFFGSGEIISESSDFLTGFTRSPALSSCSDEVSTADTPGYRPSAPDGR